MIEIRNKTAGPIQLIVRSFSKRREHAKALTTLNIPGRASVVLKDEQVVKEYLERSKQWKLLTYRYIEQENTEVHEEER